MAVQSLQRTAAAPDTPVRPALESLLADVRTLIPLMRERARQTEIDRRASPDTIARLREMGVFRLMQPASFGGYEYAFAEFIEMNRTTGRGCGSTSWCASLGMVHQWLLGLFPLEAQHDVWDADPHAMAAVSYAPSGTVRPVPGGWMANGKWSWLSNVDNSQWAIVGAMVPPADGGQPLPGFVLMPLADCTIVDDWHAVGLTGTGSKSIQTNGEVFVPAHRHLSFGQASSGTAPGTAVHANPTFRIPFLATVPLCLATPSIGIIEGAIEEYVDWIGGRTTRGAVAGGGNRMAEIAQVQSRIGEATALADAAYLVVKRDTDDVEARVRRGETVDIPTRLRNRRGHAFSANLCAQAAKALFDATGGAGLMLDSSIQRAWRDTAAIARHISLNWDGVSTMYGQHLFGLPPRGQY